MLILKKINIEEVKLAQKRVKSSAIRTPLIRLNNLDGVNSEVYLKLENLQPTGSFKIRGATNAILGRSKEDLRKGVYTASAGNMAQGVAWYAKNLGIPCTAIVPEHAPEIKLKAIYDLGAKVIKVPFQVWWQIILEHNYPGMEGIFIHPVSDPLVIAGNATIALEILEDISEVGTILVPYGGGGLSCGIASVFSFLKPEVKVFACEVETAAPLSASFSCESPKTINYISSFVDGIGSGGILPEMWQMVKELISGVYTASLNEISSAIKFLAERHKVIAEGAGATPLAVALSKKLNHGKIVCIISGGNIDTKKIIKSLQGEIP